VALVLVFLAPYGMGLLSEARAVTPAASTDQLNTVSAAVTWNGVNVDNYPSTSSAASWSFDNIATVTFSWSGAVADGGISQAFLVILFLGFPAYTKQQVQSAALPLGSISMTYDLTQFKWYLQGVYECHAYLENPAGDSLFSENFYVRVAQPYDVVVATIGLLLLTIAELYLIATVGPRALDKTRKAEMKQPQEAEEEAETSTDTGGSPPGST
jgi:hypothetical protein